MTPPLTHHLKFTDRTFCRRHIVKLGLLALSMGATPPMALAHRLPTTPSEKALDLYQTRTGERLKTIYWAAGQYIPEALTQLNHLLRDYLTDDIRPIDPRLLDFLHALANQVDTPYPFHIISAYRCPTTNAHLRQHRPGVAKRSFHMYGKAIDFYLPKRELAVVRRAGIRLRQG
ncbi:MAG: DUF882 domain-containing protein, partial [Candidatus Tectomicrobia bacterium]|nr:DUF882 domain-containing protein [Candidatus Tectomicrobia bacterium]